MVATDGLNTGQGFGKATREEDNYYVVEAAIEGINGKKSKLEIDVHTNTPIEKIITNKYVPIRPGDTAEFYIKKNQKTRKSFNETEKASKVRMYCSDESVLGRKFSGYGTWKTN